MNHKFTDCLHYIMKLLIIILLNVCIVGTIGYAYTRISQRNAAVQTLSKIGSRGEEVVQLQEKLQELGYYSGEVDGIFGSGTANAVKQFQQSQGLSADGIAGPQTLAALGVGEDQAVAGEPGGTSSDYELLARLISAESRGEPYLGQVAVGAVILNRVEHPSFPDTLAGVAYQPGAFSVMTNGQINQPVAESAYRAAKEALNGSDPSGGAIYYFNPSKTSNKFMHSRPVITQIGSHHFCS